MWENWCRSTVFRDGLPTQEHILRHPIESFWQFNLAWQRSVAVSAKPGEERRQRDLDDISKKASYRKAHGGEKEQQIDLWPEFEKRYKNMVIDEKTGRLVDEDTLPNKGEKPRKKLWLGIF